MQSTLPQTKPTILSKGYSERKPFPNWKRWRIRGEWAKPLGNPICPYATRWMILSPFGSLRLHHWFGNDDDRAYHDHPWWFWTLILQGSYIDVTPLGEELLTQGSIRFRPADHAHRVKLPDGVSSCWSFIITGPDTRFWGFWIGSKFRKANKYFSKYGHHPCS